MLPIAFIVNLLYRTLCWSVEFKKATKACRKNAAHICSSHLCYVLPAKTLPLHMHFCILVLPRSACTAKFLPKVFLYTASRLTDSALQHCKAVINLLHSLHLPHHIYFVDILENLPKTQEHMSSFRTVFDTNCWSQFVNLSIVRLSHQSDEQSKSSDWFCCEN